MSHTKEQNKTPRKQPNEMEISKLSDKEFKEMVIRMLILWKKNGETQ